MIQSITPARPNHRQLIHALGLQSARQLLPVYERTKGTKGFLSMQVNPKFYPNKDLMVAQAVELRSSQDHPSRRCERIAPASVKQFRERVAQSLCPGQHFGDGGPEPSTDPDRDLVQPATGSAGAQSDAPRGSLAVLKLARAEAAIRGREFVLPDDVKAVAVAALAHRVILKSELWVSRTTPAQVVESLLQQVPAPAAEPS